MKSILDPSFEYTKAADTDLGRRFRQAELESQLGTLKEVAEFLEQHVDTVDSEFGAKPNLATHLLREVETLIAKLKADER